MFFCHHVRISSFWRFVVVFCVVAVILVVFCLFLFGHYSVHPRFNHVLCSVTLKTLKAANPDLFPPELVESLAPVDRITQEIKNFFSQRAMRLSSIFYQDAAGNVYFEFIESKRGWLFFNFAYMVYHGGFFICQREQMTFDDSHYYVVAIRLYGSKDAAEQFGVFTTWKPADDGSGLRDWQWTEAVITEDIKVDYGDGRAPPDVNGEALLTMLELLGEDAAVETTKPRSKRKAKTPDEPTERKVKKKQRKSKTPKKKNDSHATAKQPQFTPDEQAHIKVRHAAFNAEVISGKKDLYRDFLGRDKSYRNVWGEMCTAVGARYIFTDEQWKHYIIGEYE